MRVFVTVALLVVVFSYAFAQSNSEEREYPWKEPVLDAIQGLENFVESIDPQSVDEFQREMSEYFENLPERLGNLGDTVEREYDEQINEYRLTIYNECFDLPDIEGDDSTSLRILMRIGSVKEFVCSRAREKIEPHIP